MTSTPRSDDARESAPALADYATHSPYSDPGPRAGLVAAVPPDAASLHRAVTSAVVHYRAGATPPTPDQLADVDGRWVATILATAARRAPGLALNDARDPRDQVGGCCRDHSLLAVAVLREHGVPARTRLGFASYLGAGFRTDHVVVERWVPDGARPGPATATPGRWVRLDPELRPADHAFDPYDLPTGEGSPFETAAEAWRAYRAGRTDLAAYGVAPGHPALAGPAFVHRYVLGDLAHRMRTELLLWDVWGVMAPFGEEPDDAAVALADRVADLTLAADAGDAAAHEALAALWRADRRLRPGPTVATLSPSGRTGTTDLRSRRTAWLGPGPHGPLVGPGPHGPLAGPGPTPAPVSPGR